MKSDPQAARKALHFARQSINSGDRSTARRWAEKAAALDPDLEEPWLILASIASPRASISYYEKALTINSQSEKARRGLHEAIRHLRKEQNSQSPAKVDKGVSFGKKISPSRPGRDTSKKPKRYVEPKTQPAKKTPNPDISLHTQLSNNSLPRPPLKKYSWSIFTVLVLLFCTVIIWAFWPGGIENVMAYIYRPTPTQIIPGSFAVVSKPTYTSTFTPTFTPTATFTSTPTPTETPTPTSTSTPTNTPLPTNTSIPFPTRPQNEFPDNEDTRWIDVDLSEQMLYAYEGNLLVASFLVSTGVSAYPTVTGQYHIYVKYLSTLMSGPGYYLPNVPYTMYFYRGYGIHGTYWHNNFGHPMSHGCVNMYTPDAKWMFYWASVGTLVNIHY